MGTDFADLLADIDREAMARGPEAVKLLSALDAHFSTVLSGRPERAAQRGVTSVDAGGHPIRSDNSAGHKK